MSSEHEDFKNRVIGLITEDAYNKKYFTQQIEELLQSGGARFYANLLAIFVHLQFDEQEALLHWQRIIENYTALKHCMQRDVGLRVSILDYFLNLNRLLNNPMLVEIHIFRQTEKMAMTDALTGLFNRRYLELSLRKEFKRALRHEKPLSVLMIDLDDFKQLNDTRGHLFGDMVLRRFAETLQLSCREEDTACRYGGEEFLVLLPETGHQGAVLLAERLAAFMEHADFFRENGIGFSGGIATIPDHCRETDELVRLADKALYRAKFTGKHRTLVYAPE